MSTESRDLQERKLILTDPDYVACSAYRHSLKVMEARWPDGCPPHLIARALKITEEEAADMYVLIVNRLRTLMVTDDD